MKLAFLILALTVSLVRAQPLTLNDLVFAATASTKTLVSSNTTFILPNFALDSTNAIDVGSNLRTNAAAISLAFNRPAIDSSHVLWNAMTNGSTTNVTDAGLVGNGLIVTNSNKGLWWKSNPNYSGWSGSNGLSFGNGEQLSIGANLLLERTTPWTAWAAVNSSAPPDEAAIIFTDYGANLHGYEMWVDVNGKVRLKLINDVVANAIDVQGSSVVTDGHTHVIVGSYDGSSTAAGCKIYVDGALETPNVLLNTLSATVVGSGPFLIGNQASWTNQYWWRGAILGFAMEVTNEPAAYIAAHSSSGASFAPSNAWTALRLMMNDAGTAMTVLDSSSNNFTCTLSGAEMWITGKQSVPALMGDVGLNGNSGAIQYADNALFDVSSNFTFSAWAVCNAGLPELFDRYNGSAGGVIFAGWTGTIQFWDNNAFHDFTLVPPTGVWVQHVARFVQGGTLEYWTNGVLAKQLTGVPPPVSAIGHTMGVGGVADLTTFNNGPLSLATISRTNRSNAYIAQYATRYPTAGIASLSSPTTANTSGGGDLGVTSTITNIAASFALPSTSTIQYRIGAGASGAAATTAKLAASFTTLAAGNNQISGVSGRFTDFDFKLIPSTDPLLMFTSFLTNVTLTYTQ